MSHNTFGHLFRVTTWGESHGPAIGCVIDGCPPGIPLTEDDIQPYLDKRRPGQSRFTTQRQEEDKVRILSGVFPDEAGTQVTTGTPIALVIENQDQRSKDYSEIKDKFRPGHADYTYIQKYGIRDYRGGGRSSARETAMRVAAGAVARKVLPGVTIRGALVQLGTEKIDRANWDWEEVDRNPFFSPDHASVQGWAAYLDAIRKAGSSCGAVVEVVAEGVAAGLGAPIYGKLDQDIAAAFMSINAAKGVEIGEGFACASFSGEENADEMRIGPDGKPRFPLQSRGRHPWRHFDRPADRCAFRRQTNLFDPDAPPHHRRAGPRDRHPHKGSARSLRRHQSGAGGGGDDGACSCRSFSKAPRTDWLLKHLLPSHCYLKGL